MSPSKEELEDLERELRRLTEVLHGLSEWERAVGQRMHPVEVRATALGATRITTAMRAAFVSLTNAGALMTQAHIDMNVPLTIFHPQAVEAGTPIEEQHKIEQEVAITQGAQTEEQDEIEQQIASQR